MSERIAAAIAHLPVRHQLSIIMAWMSIEDLEQAAKTICK